MGFGATPKERIEDDAGNCLLAQVQQTYSRPV